MIKLIAIDLDGTLLSPLGEISYRNIEAIEKAQQAGIQVIIATGRSFQSASLPLSKANLSCPIICANGAEMYTDDGERIHAIEISKDIIYEVIRIAQEEEVFIEVYTNKGIYANEQADLFNKLVLLMKRYRPDLSEADIKKQIDQRFQDEEVLFTDQSFSLIDQPDVTVLKALILSLEKNKLDAIHDIFNQRTDIVVTSSSLENIEFNHPQAQKGIALKLNADKLNISKDQIMAIGDNYNDLSMLELAGRSVAMGNAVEEIKKRTDYITASNDEDGVAKAIEKILN